MRWARLLRSSLLGVGLALSASSALAATCPAPNPYPYQDKCLSSADLNRAFANAYEMFMSPTAPSNPLVFQWWANTAAVPYVINQYDGSAWVQWGTLNPTTHVLTLTGAGGGTVTSVTGSGIISCTPTSGAVVCTGSGSGGTPAGPTNALQTNAGGGNFGSITPATGIAAFLATPSSANLAAALTDETGTGLAVFGTNPTLIGATLTGTLALGTQTISGNFTISGVPILTNIAIGTIVAGGNLGLDVSGNLVKATLSAGGVTSVATTGPITGGTITTTGTIACPTCVTSAVPLTSNSLLIGQGLQVEAPTTTGTGVLAALGVNVGSAGAFVVNGGALGTPSSGTLTNATGLPIGGVSGMGTGVGTFLVTPSSANFAAVITNETGTGLVVFNANPTLAGATLSGTLALGTQTISGGFTASGVPLLTGLSSGTQVSCLGLDSGNHIVLNAAACGSGSGGPTSQSGTTVTISGHFGNVLCTATCSVTPPVPTFGDGFCVMMDTAVTGTITIVNPGSSVQFGKPDQSGYGTATTGTMVSQGTSPGDSICLFGRSTTKFNTSASDGRPWVVN